MSTKPVWSWNGACSINFPKPRISQQVGEVCEKEMIVWGRFFKIVLLTLENKADWQTNKLSIHCQAKWKTTKSSVTNLIHTVSIILPGPPQRVTVKFWLLQRSQPLSQIQNTVGTVWCELTKQSSLTQKAVTVYWLSKSKRALHDSVVCWAAQLQYRTWHRSVVTVQS